MCATFEVTLGSGTPANTRDINVDGLFETYPDLRRHRCESGHHRSFETEACRTETVHLLEHLAVELLVQEGISRDQACGRTGIPKQEISDSKNSQKSKGAVYRVQLYGGQSLEHMDALLHKAAGILQSYIGA